MNQYSNKRRNNTELEKNNGKKENKRSYYYLWEELKRTTPSKLSRRLDKTLDENIIKDDRPEDFYWKIVLAGDGAVGKTTLRKRYLGENFSGDYIQTLGADFATREDIVGSKKVKYVIWDLAGQPYFHMVRKAFYKGVQGALVVCDLTNRTSFDNFKHWINEIWTSSGIGPIPFVVVANKADLREDGVTSLTDKVINDFSSNINQETRKEYGFGVQSIITSAKTGYNVNKAFKQLAIQIISHSRYLEKLSKDPNSKTKKTVDKIKKM